MTYLQITQSVVNGETLYQVTNADNEILAQRKSMRAAENYIAKFAAQKIKLEGKRIHVQQPIKGDFDPNYFIEPGGKALARDKFEKWLSHGLIAPVGDALFPGMTQTYELAE